MANKFGCTTQDSKDALNKLVEIKVRQNVFYKKKTIHIERIPPTEKKKSRKICASNYTTPGMSPEYTGTIELIKTINKDATFGNTQILTEAENNPCTSN